MIAFCQSVSLKMITTTMMMKTGFVITGLKQQLSKIDNSSLNTTHSASNFGFIFKEHLTFSDQISSLSKSYYSHIRELRCIRPYLDSKTASTIAASTVHSKLNYCNYTDLNQAHKAARRRFKKEFRRGQRSSVVKSTLICVKSRPT